ncbi:NACHT, LRR and PYD domains-containing protein 12 [Thalassophryne amazonica]|uniref:NACHT, LRR and PYD domains-containing protein 12 n=1 Tax=Thalassophryne amazonica TaxID=390379 RepID=UPI001470CFE2|nr:NACHT, LRR and PYD domains-containing protein 12 [Thalassophryne amazonica]
MDKDALLAHMLKSKDTSSLLGGQEPIEVIRNNKYINLLTFGAKLKDENVEDDLLSLNRAIQILLADQIKTVILLGSEGTGKTTALWKLAVDWAKGEDFQNFSYVFHFRFRELNSLHESLNLEMLLHHHSHVTEESMPIILQKPENVLFMFDELDQYSHLLDPSVHNLCSNPSQPVSVSCLVASLLHGSLLKGAIFVVATRLMESFCFQSDTTLELFGFQKPQREAFFTAFFPEPAAANKALANFERTVGFYDFCSSPRFCWTVCSIYKSLMDAGKTLPETLSQLCIEILFYLIQMFSKKVTYARELVMALGRMASHCLIHQCSTCTIEEMKSFGFQQFLAPPFSVDAFLYVDTDLNSSERVFSFQSRLFQEFLLAVSLFLDKSLCEGMESILQKHEGHVKFVDFFLSGLSEPIQRRPLETLMGEFSSDRIVDFKTWFKSSSHKILRGYSMEEHLHCFHLLLQSQNKSLVKEIIISSARIGMSYGDLSFTDCVALNYVVLCLGQMEQLNLYGARDFTEEKALILAPAMSVSHKIILSSSSLSSGAVAHVASALSKGITKDLDLSSSHLGDAKLKILCTGLRDCKLHKLNVQACELTEECCEDLRSALTSGTSQLCVLNMMFNEIGDQGFTKLCQVLHSPQCKLQELELHSCKLTAASMDVLSAALCSGQSQLRKVNLTCNNIGDGGVKALSKSLQHPNCKLESLILFDNQLTGGCCPHLMESLQSEHCSLLELDLSVNDLGQEGAMLLCQALGTPTCQIVKLGLVRCKLTQLIFKELGLLLRSRTFPLKSLSVGLNKVGDQGVKHLWDAIAHPSCLLEELDVEMTGLTDACVEDVCAAIRASKYLKNVEMRNNSLTDASVQQLVHVMQDSSNMLEMTLKYNDFSEEALEILDECSKIRY